MKNKLAVLLFIVLVSFPIVLARSGSVKLLAVTEGGNNTYGGSVVDMRLEIKEGTGRVFIDSFPLTKLDTQITTRTARQIACDYVGDGCDSYDFFYTINSSAVIVGGPSAGAATTALTVAVLQNLKINDSVAITGTINSGNIVGTIGGLSEKIKAASDAGVKTVLVPFGETVKENNKTISLVDYGRGLNLSIVEVSTLEDVMERLTGVKRKAPERNFSISPVYISTMRNVAEALCNRSAAIMINMLHENFQNGNVLDNESLGLEQDSSNLTEKAKDAMKKGAYYSAASYCYGSGLKNTQMLLIEQNLSAAKMNRTMLNISRQVEDYRKSVDKWKIGTITDLEAYMIVNERLSEAEDNIADFYSAMKKNGTEELVLDLASAISRLNSAKSWSEFYGRGGVPIKIDAEALKNSCEQKLSEAEERYQYVNFYFPGILSDINGDISKAMLNFKSQNYAMCLFLATKAKADVDSVASSMGVESAGVDLLIDQRLNVSKNVIAEQNAKGMFPILGYSYYEYAIDLMQGNETGSKATALIYTGYSLEMSKLDIYFREYKSGFKINTGSLRYAFIFLAGFVFGVFVYDWVVKLRRKNEIPRRRNKK